MFKENPLSSYILGDKQDKNCDIYQNLQKIRSNDSSMMNDSLIVDVVNFCGVFLDLLSIYFEDRKEQYKSVSCGAIAMGISCDSKITNPVLLARRNAAHNLMVNIYNHSIPLKGVPYTGYPWKNIENKNKILVANYDGCAVICTENKWGYSTAILSKDDALRLSSICADYIIKLIENPPTQAFIEENMLHFGQFFSEIHNKYFK